MVTKNVKASLHGPLRDEVLAEMTVEVSSSIRELFTLYSGSERVNAVIAHVQRYIAEKLGEPVDPNFAGADSYTLETILETTSEILQRVVPGFISDTHREFIVRCHARGFSTSDAIGELVKEDGTIARLAQADAVGFKALKRVLVSRLAYLKPGTARWPEKKYGALWREEREQHKMEVRDIPLTSPIEQAVLLAKHADRINDVLACNEHSATDWQLLTNSLVRTLDSLRKVSAGEQQGPTNLSGSQLIAVLERLTLALDAPEQLTDGANTDALTTVLERLTLALKSPEHKAIAGEVESISTDTNIDDNSLTRSDSD